MNLIDSENKVQFNLTRGSSSRSAAAQVSCLLLSMEGRIILLRERDSEREMHWAG